MHDSPLIFLPSLNGSHNYALLQVSAFCGHLGKSFCLDLNVAPDLIGVQLTYILIVRGPHKGMKRGFAWPGMCVVNRDCKIPPIEKYKKSLSPNATTYVGIALDEPIRLARLEGTGKVSLLEKYKLTEKDATALCAKYGLLSPIYEHCRRNGCWFCPNASDPELLHMLIHHPELFDRLIQWEQEDNIFHRRLTRRETPSEVKARLLAANRMGISIS